MHEHSNLTVQVEVHAVDETAWWLMVVEVLLRHRTNLVMTTKVPTKVQKEVPESPWEGQLRCFPPSLAFALLCLSRQGD